MMEKGNVKTNCKLWIKGFSFFVVILLILVNFNHQNIISSAETVNPINIEIIFSDTLVIEGDRIMINTSLINTGAEERKRAKWKAFQKDTRFKV